MSRSAIWQAVSACRALRISSSRTAQAGSNLASARIHVELINGPFLKEGGTPAEYSAALDYAIAKGWLWKHESGTYVRFRSASTAAEEREEAAN